MSRACFSSAPNICVATQPTSNDVDGNRFLAAVCVLYIVPVSLVVRTFYSIPSARPIPSVDDELNVTEAWFDLLHLTRDFHPFNSYNNDEVRQWLLQRVHEILAATGSQYFVLQKTPRSRSAETLRGGRIVSSLKDVPQEHNTAPDTPLPRNCFSITNAALILNDRLSNITFSNPNIKVGDTVLLFSHTIHFQGTNLLVYVPGADDPETLCLDSATLGSRTFINAHIDSVPTSYGATDDGIAVVSILQLIKHFTLPGNRPQHGLLFLLNNGEEDYLNGARAFAQNPASSLPAPLPQSRGCGRGGPRDSLSGDIPGCGEELWSSEGAIREHDDGGCAKDGRRAKPGGLCCV